MASVVVLWLAASLVFLIFFVLPSNGPALGFAGKEASPELLARVKHDLGFDRPLVVQYGRFLGRLARGDLGRSYYNRIGVREIATYAAPISGSVAGGALVLALLLGVPLGVVWGRRPGPIERPARGFVLLTVSLSPLLLSAFIQLARTDVLPIGGYCEFFYPANGPDLPHCTDPLDWAARLLLPWLALGLPLAGIYARIVRALVRESAANENSGEGHRKALVAFLRLLVLDASWIIGATVIVEVFFGPYGLGRAMIVARGNYDIPTMQGVLLFVVFIQVAIYLVGNLIGGAISKEWRRT